MHIVVVNFNLKGITPAEYYRFCDEVAPAVAAVPGLVSKVWLDNSAANTFGGVYIFDSRESAEAYLASDIVARVVANPTLDNITVGDFGVIEAPTRLTRGLVAARV